jgi:flagellar hook-basal body complex protein FliE
VTPLDRVELGAGLPGLSPETEPAQSGGERFAEALGEMLRNVNQDQLDASGKIRELVQEGKGSIHEAMVAMSSAEASFRLLMEMRNRAVAAVNTLLQTQA